MKTFVLRSNRETGHVYLSCKFSKLCLCKYEKAHSSISEDSANLTWRRIPSLENLTSRAKYL